MDRGEPSSNDYALAWLRMAIGLVFLVFAQYKVLGHTFIYGGGFEVWIHRFLRDGAYPFMVPVLHDLVLPHSRLFAYLVTYGELSIGLAFTLGVLVRPASFCGLTYMLALLFASNYPGEHAALWEFFGASLNHLVFALCFVAFGMSNSERVWSVPAYLRRKHSARDEYEVTSPEVYSAASNTFNK